MKTPNVNVAESEVAENSSTNDEGEIRLGWLLKLERVSRDVIEYLTIIVDETARHSRLLMIV